MGKFPFKPTLFFWKYGTVELVLGAIASQQNPLLGHEAQIISIFQFNLHYFQTKVT